MKRLMHVSITYRRMHALLMSLVIILPLTGCALSGAHASGSPDQETQWTTYKNRQYGYEIEYPKDWQAVEAMPKSGIRATIGYEVLLGDEVQKITFLERQHGLWRGEFQIRVFANPHQYSIEEWVRAHPIEDVSGGNLIQEETAVILGKKAALRLSIFGFDHEEIAVIATNSGREILDLSFAGANPNDPDVERHKDIYKEMVASFEFVGREEPPNDQIPHP